jgi:diguanylate cyclase (GGDEF)-like protein/PAS domain S-box-containing protein
VLVAASRTLHDQVDTPRALRSYRHLQEEIKQQVRPKAQVAAVRSDRRGMTTRRLSFCAGLAGLLAVGYFLVPAWHVPLWGALGLLAAAAITVGGRRNRPSQPLAWYLLAAGVLSFITGDMIYKISNEILHVEPPFPSVADVFYLAMYPLLAAGLLLLVRARTPGRDGPSLIDALLITTALGLLSWVFLIVPYVHEADLTLSERLVSVAYPLGDVLLIAMLARLWSGGGLRTSSARLLGLGAVALLVTDTLYGLIQLHGTWNDGGPVDLGWIIFYASWGAAALHPSMRGLSEPGRTTTALMTRGRFVLLAGASLMAPAVLLLEASLRQPIDVGVVASGSAVLIMLVLARMAGFVHVHRLGMTREQALRRAGVSLVAAAARDRIHAAALDAVLDLAGNDPAVGVAFALTARAGLEVTAVSGPGLGLPAGSQLELQAVPAGVRERLLRGRTVQLPRAALRAWWPATTAPGAQAVLLSPIRAQEQLSGVLLATGPKAFPSEFEHALETLGSQVALALVRATLVEDLMQRRSEARFRSLVQNASDVIFVLRSDMTASYRSPSVERVLGYHPQELEGVPLTTLLHQGDLGRALAAHDDAVRRAGTGVAMECRLRHRDGSWRDVEAVYNSLIDDPSVQGTVLTIRDITERKTLEEELKHQAFHDSLTGLANRALFRDRVEHALARHARHGEPIAVLFLDLDDFKVVNDSLGHVAGDELLGDVADRVLSCLRTGDTAARLGGDEFAVLIEGVTDPKEAAALAERIIGSLDTPFPLEGKEIFVHASIGYALSDSQTLNADELLRAADVAMYAAKAAGKGGYEAYQPALHAEALDRLERTADLQRALEHQQFILHYQPIVALDSDQVVGVEALVRWRHPTRGLLPPDAFIPLAEETGLIVPIGQWVLEQACQQARRWDLEHPSQPPIRISVNLSARQFQQPDLVARVAGVIAETGIDPATLVLELTETLLLRDTESMLAKIQELKGLGVQLAIDDFGTGYSSLSYLKRLPVDILKVDKSFIDPIAAGPADSAVLQAIVRLGRTLHLQTVAEGVEAVDQSNHLRELGCHLGQGFYYSKPAEAEDIGELLGRQAARQADAPVSPS